MKWILVLAVLLVVTGFSAVRAAVDGAKATPDALSFTMKDIDGNDVNLAKYQGQVILMVNVASKCGFTPQYAGLEKLYGDQKDKGFVILGFPANNFKSQEPGTDAQIKAFCTGKYNVTFPMFSKISVKGDDQAPLYKYLTSVDAKPAGKGDISWNFEKILIGRDGEIVARFKSKVTPEDPALLSAIQAELARPATK